MTNQSHVIAGTPISANRAESEGPRIVDFRKLAQEIAGVSTLIGICIALLIGALVCVLNPPVFNDFLTLPLLQQAAWLVIIASSLCLLTGIIWQSHNLTLQGKVIAASGRRFHKLREDVASLSDAQKNSDYAVRHLIAGSPENALDRLEQQTSEAEHRALVQVSHYSAADLESRIADIRQRQQPLRDRIAAVVERRQSLDEVFMDLNHRQYLIERALLNTEKKAHSDDIETRLLRLTDFIKTAQNRFDEIDRLAARLTELKSEFGDLELRLTPLQLNKGLLENFTTELDALRDRLFVDIDHLEQNGDRGLASWVQDFDAAKQGLQERVSRLSEEFAKLDMIRNDIGGLLVNLSGSLKVKVIS